MCVCCVCVLWGGVVEGKCHSQNLKCQQHPVVGVVSTDVGNLNADNGFVPGGNCRHNQQQFVHLHPKKNSLSAENKMCSSHMRHLLHLFFFANGEIYLLYFTLFH